MKHIFILLSSLLLIPLTLVSASDSGQERRLLYVATPGIRNLLEYGGHGVLVFDMNNGHTFVRRIASSGFDAQGKPINVKGICVSVPLQRLYVSTPDSLISFDLMNDGIVWKKNYEGGCDRMAISPDGKTIYLPSFEKDHWHVLDAVTGDVLARVEPHAGAHNTNYGANGKEVYLAGLRSKTLAIADTQTHTIARHIGPFGGSIRPFTINGSQTLAYVCVNDLLGFEIGDLTKGTFVSRVEVQGFHKGKVARHGCPSHGIGLTPNEKEIWLCDASNRCMHVFDATTNPPSHIAHIPVRQEPGWITFSIDGRYAYPSTGEVIHVGTRTTVAVLADEHGAEVHSEKLLEIDFVGRVAVRAGCQFGVGAVGVK